MTDTAERLGKLLAEDGELQALIIELRAPVGMRWNGKPIFSELQRRAAETLWRMADEAALLHTHVEPIEEGPAAEGDLTAHCILADLRKFNNSAGWLRFLIQRAYKRIFRDQRTIRGLTEELATARADGFAECREAVLAIPLSDRNAPAIRALQPNLKPPETK